MTLCATTAYLSPFKRPIWSKWSRREGELDRYSLSVIWFWILLTLIFQETTHGEASRLSSNISSYLNSTQRTRFGNEFTMHSQLYMLFDGLDVWFERIVGSSQYTSFRFLLTFSQGNTYTVHIRWRSWHERRIMLAASSAFDPGGNSVRSEDRRWLATQ